MEIKYVVMERNFKDNKKLKFLTAQGKLTKSISKAMVFDEMTLAGMMIRVNIHRDELIVRRIDSAIKLCGGGQ